MPDVQVRETHPDESAGDPRETAGSFTMKVLNGISIAVIVALPLGLSILFNFLLSLIGWVRGEHYKLDFK